jgi:hypothetical protein
MLAILPGGRHLYVRPSLQGVPGGGHASGIASRRGWQNRSIRIGPRARDSRSVVAPVAAGEKEVGWR